MIALLKSFGLAFVILMVSEAVIGFSHEFFTHSLSVIDSVLMEISSVGLAVLTGVLLRK